MTFDILKKLQKQSPLSGNVVFRNLLVIFAIANHSHILIIIPIRDAVKSFRQEIIPAVDDFQNTMRSVGIESKLLSVYSQFL
jgi:hypothetical protein